jgi:hypothetical protein
MLFKIQLIDNQYNKIHLFLNIFIENFHQLILVFV